MFFASAVPRFGGRRFCVYLYAKQLNSWLVT
jgi:hypothetical protein